MIFTFQIKFIRSISLIILLFLITSCTNNNSMKPEDFKNKEPRLIIEEYLNGNVKAWGMLQNRSGKVIRQFTADLLVMENLIDRMVLKLMRKTISI